jgi:hypothetical protein
MSALSDVMRARRAAEAGTSEPGGEGCRDECTTFGSK